MQCTRTGGLQSRSSSSSAVSHAGGEDAGAGYRGHALRRTSDAVSAPASIARSAGAFGGIRAPSVSRGVGVMRTDGHVGSVGTGLRWLGGRTAFFIGFFLLFGGAAEFHHDSTLFLLSFADDVVALRLLLFMICIERLFTLLDLSLLVIVGN